jgi:RNA polymerase sigma-70 factor (ECF subfamily)
MSLSFKELTDELLTAYAELCRFLARRLGNTHDAADVAQSSFERAYAHALAAPMRSPRAVLFRTAQRLCIDRARRQAVAQTWQEEQTTHDAVVPSVEQTVEQHQLTELVAARLARLPARRREVFLLFHVYGYSRQEIAQRLGITEATVAKHLVRTTLDCARCFTDLRNG